MSNFNNFVIDINHKLKSENDKIKDVNLDIKVKEVEKDSR
jgi:hypothetical protein